jgi:hypothetical protein
LLFQFFSQECFAKEQTNKQKKRSPLSFRFLFSLHALPLSTLSISTLPLLPLPLPSSKNTRNGRGGAVLGGLKAAARARAGRNLHPFRAPARAPGIFFFLKPRGRSGRKGKNLSIPLLSRLGIWKMIASPLKFVERDKLFSPPLGICQAEEGKRGKKEGKERKGKGETTAKRIETKPKI